MQKVQLFLHKETGIYRTLSRVRFLSNKQIEILCFLKYEALQHFPQPVCLSM